MYVNLRTDQRYTENTNKVKWVQMGSLEMFFQSPGSPGSCPDLFMGNFVLLHVLLGIRALQASQLQIACELCVPSCAVQPSTRHPGCRCLAITETEGSSSPQVVGPLMQSPLPSEEPSPYIISSDWRCGKLMGAQCS